MADQIDLANDLIDSEVSRALEKIRQNSSHTPEGAKFCVECDEKIPDERRKMGFNLCVPCAEEGERRKSLFSEDY